jgi:hypothetical protein
MCSPSSTIQLPNGTSVRTHSVLRSDHVMLVGCTIHDAYETAAHSKIPNTGTAINQRARGLRLRPPEGLRRPPPCTGGGKRGGAIPERVLAASC